MNGYRAIDDSGSFPEGPKGPVRGDVPLLKRTLGWDLMNQLFHHHSLDVTSVARYMVDAGILPEGCQRPSNLIPHFKIREDARHTALSDAVDMGNVYLKMLEAKV